MMKPLASFVIPVKDGQAYLSEAIDSCLSQTTNRIEAVIVDDGSTDNTKDVIDFYEKKDERVRSVRLTENVGRSAARNSGVKEADANYILILDADDVAAPTRVRDTLTFFKKNPAVDIVYGQFQIIDTLGKIMGYVDAKPFDYEDVRKTKFAKIGHSTMAFKKSVFDKVMYTDGEYSANAIDDWKFQIDAFRAGFRFGAIKRILSKYRLIPKERDEKRILELKEACLS